MPDWEQILKQAQENLAVVTALQDRYARMRVELETWLEAETSAIARHQAWLEQHESAMHMLDQKLDRIADLM